MALLPVSQSDDPVAWNQALGEWLPDLDAGLARGGRSKDIDAALL